MLRKLGLIFGVGVLLVGVLFAFLIISRPERGTTGAVNTKFRLLGPSDKIVVDGFDDPKVKGVACHIARAQTGGVKGALGVAEDTSDASIACRQIGRIKIVGDIEDGEGVFDERRSLVFKALHMVRFFDRSATFWFMLLTAIALSKAAQKTASVPFRSWAGRHQRLQADDMARATRPRWMTHRCALDL